MAMVIPAPRARLLNGLDVIFLRIFSSLLPAIFSRPVDITVIPYKKNAKPPSKVNKLKIEKIMPGHHDLDVSVEIFKLGAEYLDMKKFLLN